MNTQPAVQEFINKFFFYIYVFALIFIMVLYNLIGFDYTDELCALAIFTLFTYYVSKTENWEINKVFLGVIFIFIFYLCYSLFIESNTKAAILSDLVVQIKPYLTFFCVYSFAPLFSRKQKDILKKISVFIWCLLVPVGIAGLIDDKVFNNTLGHETYYAAAVISTALTFLFCSNFSNKDKIQFILMLSIGIFSGRSKFYGFFILSIVMVFYFSNINRFKFDFKNICILIIVFIGMAFVARSKIELYFLQGITGDLDKDMIARYVLYANCFDIYKDYFPFGSGFASYGTFYSGEYYSNIYPQYGMDNVWGMTRNNHNFIADTFYPSLAQYGIIGTILYLMFWFYIIKKAFVFFQKTHSSKHIILALLITAFFAIEGIADSTFTTHRGFFVLMLLGLILSEMKYIQNQEKYHESITNR